MVLIEAWDSFQEQAQALYKAHPLRVRIQYDASSPVYEFCVSLFVAALSQHRFFALCPPLCRRVSWSNIAILMPPSLFVSPTTTDVSSS